MSQQPHGPPSSRRKQLESASAANLDAWYGASPGEQQSPAADVTFTSRGGGGGFLAPPPPPSREAAAAAARLRRGDRTCLVCHGLSAADATPPVGDVLLELLQARGRHLVGQSVRKAVLLALSSGRNAVVTRSAP